MYQEAEITGQTSKVVLYFAMSGKIGQYVPIIGEETSIPEQDGYGEGTQVMTETGRILRNYKLLREYEMVPDDELDRVRMSLLKEVAALIKEPGIKYISKFRVVNDELIIYPFRFAAAVWWAKPYHALGCVMNANNLVTEVGYSESDSPIYETREIRFKYSVNPKTGEHTLERKGVSLTF